MLYCIYYDNEKALEKALKNREIIHRTAVSKIEDRVY